MEFWVAHKKGKVIEQVLCEDGVAPMWSADAEGAKFTQADRQGDLAAEVFDPKTGTWSANPDHEAFLADFDIGPEKISAAHLMKTLEARMILAGYDQLDGLVKQEALMLGIPPVELATAIVANAQAALDVEINRRRIKKGKI